MTVFMRMFTAVWLAVMVSFGASAAEPMTGAEIKGFMSSFPELKAYAEKRRIDFEKGRNRQQRPGGKSFTPFSQGIGKMRAAGAYAGANRIVRRHWFSNLESWGGVADRILRAYISLMMQNEKPRMAAGMSQAREMIMNNQQMTPEQKAQALASINASMRNFQQMQDGSSADKVAISPYRAQLDALFENDRARRGTGRKRHGPQQGSAMPPPGHKATEGGGAVQGDQRRGGQARGVKARLSKLKELYDSGLINKQEYDAKRASILSEF